MLIMLSVLVPLAYNGYVMDFRGNDWLLMGCKTNPLDLTSSTELLKLSSGWTVMAWLKYEDIMSLMSTQIEFMVRWPSSNCRCSVSIRPCSFGRALPVVDTTRDQPACRLRRALRRISVWCGGYRVRCRRHDAGVASLRDDVEREQPTSPVCSQDFDLNHPHSMLDSPPEPAVPICSYFLDGEVVAEDYSPVAWAFYDSWTSHPVFFEIGGMTMPPANIGDVRVLFENGYDGQMDDFALFGGALTPSEVSARWNSSLTERVEDRLEPNLLFFYNFDLPLNASGEVINLGTAGMDYNMVRLFRACFLLYHLDSGSLTLPIEISLCARYDTQVLGRADSSSNGANVIPQHNYQGPIPLKAPQYVKADTPRKAADPSSVPIVVEALAGATVEIKADDVPPVLYTAPDPFNATAVLRVTTSSGGLATAHIIPIVVPSPTDRASNLAVVTKEDTPLDILLRYSGGCFSGDYYIVITELPRRGTLFSSGFMTPSQLITEPGAILRFNTVNYIPSLNGFGSNYDKFSCANLPQSRISSAYSTTDAALNRVFPHLSLFV